MDGQEYRRRAMQLAAGQFPRSPGNTVRYLSTVPSGRGTIRWDVFACLYPKPPTYRLYSREPLSAFEAECVGDEIEEILLPRDAVSLSGRPDAQQRYRAVAQFANQHGIPMGMYLTGRFFPSGGVRSDAVSALWCTMELGDAWTLSLLRRALRGTR